MRDERAQHNEADSLVGTSSHSATNSPILDSKTSACNYRWPFAIRKASDCPTPTNRLAALGEKKPKARAASRSGLVTAEFTVFELACMGIQSHGKILEEERLTSVAAIVSITERERAIREDAYRDAVTNLRLEGLEMDEEAKRIFQRHVDGQITSEEFRAAIDDLNERKFRPVSLSGNGRP